MIVEHDYTGGDGVFHNHEVGDDASFGGEMNNNRYHLFVNALL